MPQDAVQAHEAAGVHVGRYRLMAVVEHCGKALRAGHYVAYVRRSLGSTAVQEGAGQAGGAGVEGQAAVEGGSGSLEGGSGGGEAGGHGSTAEKVQQYQWYCISDTDVEAVTDAQVLAAQAYVLLYVAHR